MSKNEGIALTASNAAGRAGLVTAACLCALVLGGCSDDAPPAAQPAPPPGPTAVATSSAAPSTTPAPPSSAPPAPPKSTGKENVPTDGSCGTVTAASGQTLQVLDSHAGGVDCAQAKRVVAAFHQKIAGRQSAQSNEPVSDTVDGWLCVSGPPAAQGGTTCSMQDKSVLAAVVPVE
ncbi:hypothetical protein [Amycolatopsis anabasis]|uniref:hypothetical protein n=1 Tax=Amycolatopsis anabasis TaxID=1840409 RepID=UPI001FEA2A50|nr:hypothetical protein [Amycolatopsis anabasis]